MTIHPMASHPCADPIIALNFTQGTCMLSGPYRILCVDDSRFVRNAVKMCFQQQDFTVKEAEDGEQAIEILKYESFDLIITDIEMPNMDGFTLIETVRATKRFQYTPILFLTGVNKTEIKVKAFDLGADDYIVKPFLSKELKARVMAHLERNFMLEGFRTKAKVSDNLSEFFQSINSIDPHELEDNIVSKLVEHFQVKMVALWLYEEEANNLVLKAANYPLPTNFKLDHSRTSVLWQAYQQNEIFVIKLQDQQRWNAADSHIKTLPEDIAVLMPLLAGKKTIGLLSLTHFPERFFTNYELTDLEAIRFFIANAWSNAMRFGIIQHQQTEMQEQLEQARETQFALLPRKMPELNGMKVHIRFTPMDQIGGDAYDIMEFADGKLGLLVADATGHGISAALISALVCSLFRTYGQDQASPAMVLSKMNDRMVVHLPEDKFATVYYGIFDPKERKLLFCNRSHPAAVLVRPQVDTLIEMHSSGLPLGIFLSTQMRFEEQTIDMEPGDRVFIYTDAITEMANGNGEMFGKERLYDLLMEFRDEPVEELMNIIRDAVLNFGKTQNMTDDFTLMCFEFNPTGSQQ